MMIGAEQNTDWLDACVALDAKRFVETGKDSDGKALVSPSQPPSRVSSRSATCVRARSLPALGKAQRWCRPFTSSSAPASRDARVGA
jgi:hypothetical protein